MDNVLTLIANPAAPALSAGIAGTAAQALAAGGAGTGDADWLAPSIACDIAFCGLSPERARACAAAALAGTPVDVVAQAVAGRRKALLVADMESTIIENEMLDELAEEIGIRAQISAITARAMNGELDFEGALRERVGLLAGLDAEALVRTRARIRIMPGARTLVATMRAAGAYCALVSGGFTAYTAVVRETLGFDLDQANRLVIEGGALAGRVEEPILGRNAKEACLRRLCRDLGIGPDAAVAVGDGANDLSMLAVAGAGVAFRAKPVVAAAARHRIDHGDLTALLYLQGYRQAEIRQA